jgi:hypothetical protein
MVGGRARALPPRQLTDDPEAWPEQVSNDPAAEAVRHIARTLVGVLNERGLSLRAVADGSDVNRQAIADLIAGRSWPDVATVTRAALWPQQTTADRNGKH